MTGKRAHGSRAADGLSDVEVKQKTGDDGSHGGGRPKMSGETTRKVGETPPFGVGGRG